MASEGPYRRVLLSNNIKRLEAEGRLPKEKGKELREKRRREKNRTAKEKKSENSNIEIDNKLKFKILKVLRKGLSTRAITRKLKITAKILEKATKQLISERAITEDEIKAAQEDKKMKDRRIVLDMLLEGAYPKEIESKIQCTEAEYIVILNKLKEEGLTDEEIKKARDDRKQRELAQLMNLVEEGLENGLTQKEIADIYKQKYGKSISLSRIIDCAKKIKSKGTKMEKIEVAQRERKKAKTEERRIDSERPMG